VTGADNPFGTNSWRYRDPNADDVVSVDPDEVDGPLAKEDEPVDPVVSVATVAASVLMPNSDLMNDICFSVSFRLQI